MGPDPAVAATRLAVRRTLAELAELAPAAEHPAVVLVACSGGADSLALLSACAFEARPRDQEPPSWRVVGVTVDHGLQEGSAERAAHVVAQMDAVGVAETFTARVRVGSTGQGPEAAAREARYAVLDEVAARTGAVGVLLGHTLDDQAETVLLGLTRGSGGRSIAGMRRSFAGEGTTYARPLLDLRRADTEAACRAVGLDFWVDPHNSDPRFARSRVRRDVLPVLERELGPGVAETLARTADSLRLDMEALDVMADLVLEQLTRSEAQTGGQATGQAGLPVTGLLETHPAVRRRVLRTAALGAGAPAAELTHGHVLALESLVAGWRGQRWIDLPGHLRGRRESDRIVFERTR